MVRGPPEVACGEEFAMETAPATTDRVLLRDSMFASEVAGCLVHVVAATEPYWCRNKRFKQLYMCGRRCGLEETEYRVWLDLKAGSVFSYHRHDHEHDAESRYSFDRHGRANGQWLFDADSADEDGRKSHSLVRLSSPSCNPGRKTRLNGNPLA